MVKDTGKAPGSGALRPLNTPKFLRVRADVEGHPVMVAHREAELQVLSVADHWRVEDEWWRDESISRSYYEVLVADGRRMTLYQDVVTTRWYEQRDG